MRMRMSMLSLFVVPGSAVSVLAQTNPAWLREMPTVECGRGHRCRSRDDGHERRPTDLCAYTACFMSVDHAVTEYALTWTYVGLHKTTKFC